MTTNTEAPVATRAPLADADLATLMVTGVLIGVIGSVLAGLTWPYTSIDGSGLYATSVKHGSAVGSIIGLVIAGVGGIVLQVAIIGYGVLAGMRAAAR